MEAIDSAQFFEGHYEVPEKDLMPSDERETEGEYLDNYDEPANFFKGAVLSLFFCLPFWIILFRLIF